MDASIRDLVEKARRGQVADGYVLAAALRREAPEVALLVELAGAVEAPLRVAAADAARGRAEPELRAALEPLASDPSPAVRIALARALGETPAWDLGDGVLRELLGDREAEVRRLVLPAAGGRRAVLTETLACLEDESAWVVREAAARALQDAEPGRVDAALLLRVVEDDDRDVARAAAASLEAHLEKLGQWPEGAALPSVGALRRARERVTNLGERRLPLLHELLVHRTAVAVDVEGLRRHGTDLSEEAEAGRLPPTFGLDAVCDQVVEVLAGQAPRAVVFLGEPGTGKTAAVNRLVERLAAQTDGPWRVVRLAPNDILVGTVYLGEWQTKLQKIIDLVSRPRRVLLYVPNVEQLVNIGRSSSSDANAASMLMPYLESGDVAVLGESTPDAFRTGLAREPSFRRLFTAVRFRPAGPEETRRIAEQVCEAAHVPVGEGALDRLLELAGFYRHGSEEPGRSVGLLRRVLEERDAEAGEPLGEADVLRTVSRSTGIPLAMLDDTAALDLAQVRRFFEERVMGQGEAVGAVLDLVTLIKAGLTDPHKPYGVLFFVGPTGVGKTELARALAEFLFGQASRLVRFDMSEYATFSAFERLLGTGGRPGLLTQAVQEEPFGVILLDEIEKAHVNVYDLCLQIFDAGRLTDTRGRTADFRRSIVILTSNVGSAVPSEAGVGFGEPTQAPPDAHAIDRALRETFRPEFLGRLDRVVYFQPLALETAERIARRELTNVLRRAGIARRGLQVDVDPALLSLLLRAGYSSVLGARPLKRTVERLVLMPLARAIAQGRVPPRSIVRLVPKGRLVGIEVDRAEPAPGGPAERPAGEAGRAALEAAGTSLRGRLEGLEARAETVERRRADLLAAARAPGFWDEPDTARRTLAEVHQTEALRGALRRLRQRVEATGGHVRAASTRRARAELATRMEELGRECDRLDFLLATDDPVQLGDAYVQVALVARQGPPLEAVEKLARMVQGYARRHDLEVDVLSDRRGRDVRDDEIILLVSGLGAYALLAPEAGLHQLRRAGREGAPNRALARVDVWPDAADAGSGGEGDLRVRTRPLRKVRGRLLARPTLEVAVIDRPSMHSVTAWTDRAREGALDGLAPLLRARAAAGPVEADPTSGPVVRRYTFGPSPLVRDQRTGRTTGRLDEVLAGDLDRLRTFSRGEDGRAPAPSP